MNEKKTIIVSFTCKKNFSFKNIEKEFSFSKDSPIWYQAEVLIKCWINDISCNNCLTIKNVVYRQKEKNIDENIYIEKGDFKIIDVQTSTTGRPIYDIPQYWYLINEAFYSNHASIDLNSYITGIYSHIYLEPTQNVLDFINRECRINKIEMCLFKYYFILMISSLFLLVFFELFIKPVSPFLWSLWLLGILGNLIFFFIKPILRSLNL